MKLYSKFIFRMEAGLKNNVDNFWDNFSGKWQNVV